MGSARLSIYLSILICTAEPTRAPGVPRISRSLRPSVRSLVGFAIRISSSANPHSSLLMPLLLVCRRRTNERMNGRAERNGRANEWDDVRNGIEVGIENAGKEKVQLGSKKKERDSSQRKNNDTWNVSEIMTVRRWTGKCRRNKQEDDIRVEENGKHPDRAPSRVKQICQKYHRHHDATGRRNKRERSQPLAPPVSVAILTFRPRGSTDISVRSLVVAAAAGCCCSTGFHPFFLPSLLRSFLDSAVNGSRGNDNDD